MESTPVLVSTELKLSVDLSVESKVLFNNFIKENRERKGIDPYDTFEVLAKGSEMVSRCKCIDRKKITPEQHRKLLECLYKALVADEANDFEENTRLNDSIDLVLKLRGVGFQIDLGKKGCGCFPCFSSFKVDARF